MKKELRKAYEAGQKSVIGEIDDGYFISANKRQTRQTFNEWYDCVFKKIHIPLVIKSVCDCLFPDYRQVENNMVCGNCNLPKKKKTVL